MKHYVFFVFMLLFINTLQAQQYHEQDKEGLRKFLEQKSQTSILFNYNHIGLKSFNIQNWMTSESWISTIGKEIVEWDNNVPKRIVKLNFTQDAMVGSFDASYFPNLKILNLARGNYSQLNISQNINLEEVNLDALKSISTIDFSKNINLKKLSIINLNFQYLDISKNVKLEHLDCYNNKLTKLDLSKNRRLSILKCYNNNLNELDLSKNFRLAELNCNSNKLTQLDLSKNFNLGILFCENNLLTQLDLSKNVNLERLRCNFNKITKLNVNSNILKEITNYNNNFKLSTLPLPNKSISTYQYYPQSVVDMGEMEVGGNIDLSSEYSIDGNISTYTWLRNGATVTLKDMGNGVFVTGENFIGSTLICRVRNKVFPFITLEYKVEITPMGEYHKDDKEGLRKLLLQPSAVEGRRNWQVIGLTSEDIADWEASEEWIEKVHGVLWNESTPKRISQIYLEPRYNLEGRPQEFAGIFEGKYFPELQELSLKNNKFSAINISDNVNLSLLDLTKTGLKTIDLFNNFNIEKIDLSNNQLSGIDVSKNIKLLELRLSTNNLTTLDVSKNINLRTLQVDFNKLNSLDVSKNIKLTELSCTDTGLTALDISKNKDLVYLGFANNQLTNIDISNNTKLQILIAFSNKLKALDVSNLKYLTTMYISSNKLINLKFSKDLKSEAITLDGNQLLFSNMPLPAFVSLDYRYAPQQDINGGKIKIGSQIDLSSEKLINGKKTTYQWFNNDQPIELTAKSEGVFIVDEKYVGSTLVCEMKNQTFPDLTLRYVVEVSPSFVFENPVLEDHLQLITSEPSKHFVYTGESFSVLVNLNKSESVKIGLFNLKGEWVQDITQTVDHNIYSCKIDNNIQEGDYVLIPYITDSEGKVIRIKRSEASDWIIDRLPLTVGAVNRNMFSTNSNETTKDMGEDSKLVVYPNPASDYLYLNIDNQEVEYAEIYNLNGTLIRKVNQLEKYNNSYRLTIHDLNSGMYIVKLKTPKKVLSYKMIKK